jgi:pyruvate dehydrogenase E2 component (dihydrolipoamide acetyltransferase)
MRVILPRFVFFVDKQRGSKQRVQILLKEGTQDVPIGKPVAIIVEDEEDVSAFKDVDPSQFLSEGASGSAAQQPTQQQTASQQQEKEEKKPQETVSARPPSSQTAAPQTKAQSQERDRTFASPYAKKLAYEKSIDISKVSASGPSGRVLASDVLSSSTEAQVTSEAVSSSAAYTDIKLSNMRKVGQDLLSWIGEDLFLFHPMEDHCRAFVGIETNHSTLLSNSNLSY